MSKCDRTTYCMHLAIFTIINDRVLFQNRLNIIGPFHFALFSVKKEHFTLWLYELLIWNTFYHMKYMPVTCSCSEFLCDSSLIIVYKYSCLNMVRPNTLAINANSERYIHVVKSISLNFLSNPQQKPIWLCEYSLLKYLWLWLQVHL